MSIRLVIADDHPLFKMGLNYALSHEGLEVVAEANNGQEALEVCLEHKPDMVLMDIRMPVLDGIAACQQITAHLPQIMVVMLTTFDAPGIIQAATKAGAKAYVSKETDPRKLADTLKQIFQYPNRHWMPRVRLPQFTRREEQVLGLMSQGLSNKEMARHLELSPDTIKDHLEKVYGKLEATDRISALNKARELGLLG